MRRLRVLVLFGLCAVGCGQTPTSDVAVAQGPGAGSAANVPHDWPGFLGPLGTSVSTETGIVAPWPKDGPKILWTRPLKIGYAMPSVARGKLYHFERDGDQARVVCMTADTGKDVWSFSYATDYRDKYNYNGGPRCCPVIDGGLVYVHGVEGVLHCLKADTGEVVWRVDTRKEFGVVQNFFGVGSTPVVEGDLLIVPIGGSPPGADAVEDFQKTPNNGTGVVAFDKRTGKVAYKIGEELASYASPTLATIDGRRWCFVLARGGLLAFEPKTGKIDFHFPWRAADLESVNAANPVVVGKRVFVSETYGPGAALLEVRSGGYDVVWSDARKTPRTKSMLNHWATSIHVDGHLYGCSGRHEYNAELRCVEWETGKVLWSVGDLTRTSLLQIDGHFVCLSEEGILRLLKINPKKYDVVSEVELVDPMNPKRALLKSPCWAAPIVSHGRLYVRGDDRLVCLELIPAK